MSNKKATEFSATSKEPRYIMLNEDIYDALNLYERAVYEALRYEADYSKESSIVKRSINFLVQKSKVSRRHIFRCLISLETVHFLIQRIQMPVTGIQNNYNVSRTLNFFNSNRTSAYEALVDNNCTEKPITSASQSPPSASQSPPSAYEALLISNSFSNLSNNTTTSISSIFEHTQGQLLEGQPQDPTAEKFKRDCLTCPECLEIFEERFSNCDITLKQLYDDCADYWRQSNQLVYKSRFLSHLKKCPIERLIKKHVNNEVTSAPYPEGYAIDIEERARLQEEFSKKRYEEEQERWKNRERLPPRTKVAIDLKPLGYAPRKLSNFLPLNLDHKTNN